jgi:hypothetical protein
VKGDWIVIAVLVVLFGLLTEAAGAPILLGALNIIAGWLNALPGATEHWASTLGSIAWPAAALLMVWWLREPVALAASKLAARFEKDDVEIGFLKVTNASLITLDEGAAAGRPATPESEDAIIVERLLEFAAESDENAGKLRDWISTEIGPTWDAEEFLSDDRYRDHRTRALQAMTGGE